jgi:hypothetical protein
MALGDPYCSTLELRDYCQINDDVDDSVLSRVAQAVSSGIELYCHRQFNDSGAATADTFVPQSPYHVVVYDFHTITGLVVKTGSAFGTTLTDYTLEPLNGISHGRPGFPYRKIRLHSSSFTSTDTREPTVQVTARWGWAAVPADIRLAALMQGARKFRRRYSPSGLQTMGEYTTWVSRIEDPDVKELLAGFVVPSIQFC